MLRFIYTERPSCRFTYDPQVEVRVKIPENIKDTHAHGTLQVFSASLYEYLWANRENYTKPLRGIIFLQEGGGIVCMLYTNAQMVTRKEYTLYARWLRDGGLVIEEGK
jgi:hypothetical protein